MSSGWEKRKFGYRETRNQGHTKRIDATDRFPSTLAPFVWGVPALLVLSRTCDLNIGTTAFLGSPAAFLLGVAL